MTVQIKNMKLFTFLFSILLLVSCSDNAMKEELAQAKNLLEIAEEKLANADEDNYPLVHIVYFKLKPDADQAALMEEINKIEAIEVLHDLEVGTFEDLEDQRALSDYQLMMSMAFKNEAEYKIYQTHELHLGLKKNIGQFLAAPPATYDYIKR